MINKSTTHKDDPSKMPEPTLILKPNLWNNQIALLICMVFGMIMIVSAFSPMQWIYEVGLAVLFGLFFFALHWLNVRATSLTVRGDVIELRTSLIIKKPQIYNTKDITVVDIGYYSGLYGPAGLVANLNLTLLGKHQLRALAKTIGVRVCDNDRAPDCPGRKIIKFRAR